VKKSLTGSVKCRQCSVCWPVTYDTWNDGVRWQVSLLRGPTLACMHGLQKNQRRSPLSLQHHQISLYLSSSYVALCIAIIIVLLSHGDSSTKMLQMTPPRQERAN
jgi:hypothetical protein